MRGSLQAVFAAALLTLWTPAIGGADPIIYQTAIQQPARGGGSSLFTRQFIGVKFFVSERATTRAIGGLFGEQLDIFGAVVRLSSASDFPDSTDLSTPDVLGATRIFDFSGNNQNAAVFSQRLSLTLEGGWYALVFGSGLFGTVNSEWGGALPTTSLALGHPRFFISGGFDPGTQFRTWVVPRTTTPFLFIEGDVSQPAVPEPGTMTLVLFGVVALLRRHRHAIRAPLRVQR